MASFDKDETLKQSGRLGIGLFFLILAIVFLFAVNWLMNLDDEKAPSIPEVPQPAGAVQTPKVPDNATNIMRIQDIDFASYDRGLAQLVTLELGESMATATPKIESYFSPQGGTVEDAENIMGPNKTETEFSTFGAQGGKVTLVERVNIKDDSVKAEQFYAIFKAKGDGFILADYGLKLKCHRGENTAEWTTELCP